MAKAYATCTCKHCGKEFEVSAFKRNRKEAASWSDWAARTYDCCNECADRIRAEENARNAAEAKEMGLPELVGSPKQIAWAESIRMDMKMCIRDRLYSGYSCINSSIHRCAARQ